MATSKRKSSGLTPRLITIVGLAAAALLAYVGARGGPGHAAKEVKEAAGLVSPPRIVSLQPRTKDPKAFVVSIENPSLRQIQITSFYAESSMQFAEDVEAGAGPLPVLKAELARAPAQCGRSWWFQLVTPLVIQPESAGGLEIKPWREPCDFKLRVVGTSGASQPARWTPQSDAVAARLKH